MPKSGIAGSYGSSMYRFLRYLHTVLHSGYTNLHSHLFSTSPPALVICGLVNDGHSDWCEVVPHSNFDLHFSNNQWCWAFFHVLVGHLYIFFEEIYIQFFCLFFNWIVGFFAIELYKLFVYFQDEALVSCIVWSYFLSLCKLSFSFVCVCVCWWTGDWFLKSQSNCRILKCSHFLVEFLKNQKFRLIYLY